MQRNLIVTKQPIDGEAERADLITQAYHQLRELIVWGRLAPGTRIVETDVATRLGISRTPVRSALHRLQQEGYIIAGEGGLQSRLLVAPLTKEDARELFSIIREVEALSAACTAQLAPDKREIVIADLHAINNQLQGAASSDRKDPHSIFDYDQDFHRRMVDGGAGPRLLALHDAIKPQTERYVRLYISALLDEIGTSVDEHQIVIRSIQSGDPLKATDTVRWHWRNATDRLSRVIEMGGERGKW